MSANIYAPVFDGLLEEAIELGKIKSKQDRVTQTIYTFIDMRDSKEYITAPMFDYYCALEPSQLGFPARLHSTPTANYLPTAIIQIEGGEVRNYLTAAKALEITKKWSWDCPLYRYSLDLCKKFGVVMSEGKQDEQENPADEYTICTGVKHWHENDLSNLISETSV